MCLIGITFLFVNFLYLSASANNPGQHYLPEEIQILSNPTVLGRHILTQLGKKESRGLSTTCFNQLLKYGSGLLGFKMWAWQLLDATEKLPSGLSLGNGGALGSFDQCLGISENTSVGIINGKYCIGSIELADLDGLNFNIQISQRYTPRFLHIPKNKIIIPWGICLPDGCAADDFKVVTLFLFKYSDDMCQTAKSQISTFDQGDYIAIGILSVIGFLVVVSTAFERFTRSKPETPLREICISFSIIANYNKITSHKIDEDEIRCFHGLRIINMFFIMVGTRFIMYPLSPNDNWLSLLEFVTKKYSSILLEAFICIDTLLVISGTLVSYNFLCKRSKGIKFNLIFYILNRIVRFTPVLAIVVMIQTTLLRHLGSGPLWPVTKDLFIIDSCREYWWTTLLYIQNYFNPGFTSICVVPSWFISINMQLFIISSLLLWPLAKAPKYTIGFVSFLLVCAVCTAFITSWIYEIKSIFILNIMPSELDHFLKKFFYPMHTRASPWIIGFILGYIIFESKKPKCRRIVVKILSPLVVTALWLLAMGMLAFSLLISQTFLELEYDWVYHSLQNAFVRPIWAIAISWIIFACVHGYGGPVNALLSSSGNRILSKIVYSTMLVNFTLVVALTAQTRKGLHFSLSDGFSRVWADFALSLIVGLLLTLLIEYPWITILKTIGKKYCREERARDDESIETGKMK